MKEILNSKQVLEMVTSTPIVVLASFLFLVLCIIAVIFTKELLITKRIKKVDTGPSSTFREIPAKLNMSISEILAYFEQHYKFTIGQDSYLIIDKAKQQISKVEDLKDLLNNDLLAVQIGAVIDTSEIVKRVNEAGALSIVVDNELEMSYKLFKYLVFHDVTYEEEFNEIISLRSHYKTLEKELLGYCISLITELPSTK